MAAIDLTTVTLVREWIPAPSGTPNAQTLATQNAVLQAAITAASLDFLRRTGYGLASGSVPAQSPFVQAVQYSETYNGNGNDTLFLRNRPVISIQSLAINGLAVQASSGSPNAGYMIGGNGNSVVLIPSGPGFPAFPQFGTGLRFARGTQNIAITYTAGFPSQSITNELQTIPSSGPFTVLTSLPWLADGGVKYFSNGNPLTQVQIAPAQGQYYLNGSTYLFNAADVAAQIQISYTATGTPPDIQNAVTRMIYLMYQRRSWEGLRSLAKPDLGQTTYSSWEIDPSVKEVIDNYSRTALV